MALIEVEGLRKTFGGTDGEGGVVAVDDVNFEIDEGELFTLLGPSGCGKTTTLRCIAGLEEIDGGEIRLKDEVVSSRDHIVFPEHRDMGLMYQSYALWPHMTVRENIMYALKGRNYPKAQREDRLDFLLDLVNMPEVKDRYPSQLSGGQQQRVALARAISYDPAMLLMDEPLSNLDFKQRREMRTRLIEILDEVGITTLYVTHDQEEAFEISDEVVVMNEGRMVQQGRPDELYNNPQSTFVADFLGEANIYGVDVREIDRDAGTVVCALHDANDEFVLTGTFTGGIDPEAGDVALVMRPEYIEMYPDAAEGEFASYDAIEDERDRAQVSLSGNGDGEVNTFSGTVLHSLYRGSFTQNIVDVGGLEFKVKTDRLLFDEGDDVVVHIPPENALVVRH